MSEKRPASDRNISKPRDQTTGLRRQATLRDVAVAAGVSPMTVSNLVNGRHGKMSPQTRQRIEREIRRLGYRPHTMARNFRRSEWLSIGMIIVDDAPSFLVDPLNNNLVAGLSNILSQHDYGVMIQGIAPDHFQQSMLIRGIRTDGICAILSGRDAFRRKCIETLLALGQPLVVFQDVIRIRDENLCVIRQDDRGGARLLGNEVLTKGARHLMMLVPELYWPAMGERIKGVRDAIHGIGSPAVLRVVKCQEDNPQDIQDALSRAIQRHGKPDAVLAGNDQIGIAAMKLLQARGLTAPRDILITGFNAFDFWHYTDPMLTTIRSPVYEMGARGGREILAKLSAEGFAAPEIVYPVEFLPGGST